MTRAPEPPPEAADVFGAALPQARHYADLLASTGISHGLVGPREAPRLWQRHLVNCALMESLLPEDCTLVDIGSGAGLPGIVLAVVRPDVQVHLVEPLLRRTTWLESTVQELELGNVTVHRGRAQEITLNVPVATARAVASLEKLIAWSFPLLSPGGRLLALKGGAAAAELEQARPVLEALGVEHSALHVLGEGRVSEPVRVVEVVRPETLRTAVGQQDAQGGRTPQAGGREGRRRRRGRPGSSRGADQRPGR